VELVKMPKSLERENRNSSERNDSERLLSCPSFFFPIFLWKLWKVYILYTCTKRKAW
jgi:hypothetical protein